MTLVALQTNPVQSYHGSAASVEESRNKASLQALNQLAQCGSQDKNDVEPTLDHKKGRHKFALLSTG